MFFLRKHTFWDFVFLQCVLVVDCKVAIIDDMQCSCLQTRKHRLIEFPLKHVLKQKPVIFPQHIIYKL